MVEEDKAGKKPLFRNRNWNRENRYKLKKIKQHIGTKATRAQKKTTKLYFLSHQHLAVAY